MDISLQFDKSNLKRKKCIFIYENWLIVAIIYHSSQVGNRTGVHVSRGKGRGFDLEKQLKVNNWWSCNKWGSGSNIVWGRNMICPSITYLIPYMLHFQVRLNGMCFSSFTRFSGTGTPSDL